MSQIFSNNAKTTLTANITSSQTTLTVTDASLFSGATSPNYELITLEDSSGNVEIVKATDLTVNTFTIERGFEGTTPFAFNAADTVVEARLTAGSLDLLPKYTGTSLAVGPSATASNSSLAVGASASAGGTNSIAMGANATTSAGSSIAVGANASTSASNCTAIGYQVSSSCPNSLSVGSTLSNSGITGNILVGYNSNIPSLASPSNTILLGNNTLTTLFGSDLLCIGSGFTVSNTSFNAATSIIIGNSIIGLTPSANLTNAVAIGHGSSVTASGLAIGSGTKAGAGIALGANANTNVSAAPTASSIVIGADAYSTGTSSIAIGNLSKAGVGGTAVGHSASVTSSGVSVGASANVTLADGVAIGTSAQSLSAQAIAIGYQASVGTTSTSGIAIGYQATVSPACIGSVAIGAGAVCDIPAATVILGTSYLPTANAAGHTRFFSRITGTVTLIGTPVIASSVWNTVSSNLVPSTDMSVYTNQRFIAEAISFVVLSGTVGTLPTITLTGNKGSLAFTPTNTAVDSISQSAITPTVISTGTGTLTLVNTVASTGTFTARVIIHGYFVGL